MDIRNFGTQIKAYNDIYESLPFEIDIGVSQLLENAPVRWYLTFENVQKWNIALSNPSRLTTDLDGNITEEKITFFNNIFRHLLIGAELFPESIFNIRLGYNFKRGEELKIIDQSNFSGLSFGFGMKFNKLRINYTHAKFSSAANTIFMPSVTASPGADKCISSFLCSSIDALPSSSCAWRSTHFMYASSSTDRTTVFQISLPFRTGFLLYNTCRYACGFMRTRSKAISTNSYSTNLSIVLWQVSQTLSRMFPGLYSL